MGAPTDKDILDYMCFLSKTANVPKVKAAKFLGICPKWLGKRADRGALWVDHFLAIQKGQVQALRESDIKDFEIENLSEKEGIFL